MDDVISIGISTVCYGRLLVGNHFGYQNSLVTNFFIFWTYATLELLSSFVILTWSQCGAPDKSDVAKQRPKISVEVLLLFSRISKVCSAFTILFPMVKGRTNSLPINLNISVTLITAICSIFSENLNRIYRFKRRFCTNFSLTAIRKATVPWFHPRH